MYLYVLRCSVTGESYIGATTLSMPLRLGGHRQDAAKGRTTLISQAIREHGWKSFRWQILGETDEHAELMRMERATIKALGTLTPNGYNMASGGLGVPELQHSLSTRQKISASRLGTAPWNKGKKTGPMIESTREALRRANTGRPSWNKGIPATEDHRRKLREAKKRPGQCNRKQIEFDGIRYTSITGACAATGMSAMQMKYRLRLGRAKYL